MCLYFIFHFPFFLPQPMERVLYEIVKIPIYSFICIPTQIPLSNLKARGLKLQTKAIAKQNFELASSDSITLFVVVGNYFDNFVQNC